MKPQYSSGNAVEDESRLKTHDFLVLDCILGAKLLEPAAKNPKFDPWINKQAEFQKGDTFLWYIFQKRRE